jgi:hypothetical protein
MSSLTKELVGLPSWKWKPGLRVRNGEQLGTVVMGRGGLEVYVDWPSCKVCLLEDHWELVFEDPGIRGHLLMMVGAPVGKEYGEALALAVIADSEERSASKKKRDL